MYWTGTPVAPDVAARPSSATSLAVSKPRPKSTPERVHVPALADHLEHGPEQPRQQTAVVEVVLEPCLVVLAAGATLRNILKMSISTIRLMKPMTSRNVAETAVPIRPPTSWNAGMSLMMPARDGDQHASARRRSSSGRARRRSPRRPALALLHELARRVVDGGDVVGVDRVAQAERVGEEGGRQEDGINGADCERDHPRADVEDGQDDVDRDQPVAQVAGACG